MSVLSDRAEVVDVGECPSSQTVDIVVDPEAMLRPILLTRGYLGVGCARWTVVDQGGVVAGLDLGDIHAQILFRRKNTRVKLSACFFDECLF